MLRGLALYGRHQASAVNGPIALGRNLYPLLPEDAFDRAPLVSGPFRLVADVRLDNRDALIASLDLAGRDPARMCDSALLLEALIAWGADAPTRLVGEFAFALWDGARQELLLGRDFMGLRPLYYHHAPEFFAFASMPSGLHALEAIPYDVNTNFVAERLALVPLSGSATQFRAIERVEPGHVVRVKAT